MIPLINHTYKHKNTGAFYIVEKVIPVKIDDKWIENGVVIYRKKDYNEQSYARLTSDFIKSFSIV